MIDIQTCVYQRMCVTVQVTRTKIQTLNGNEKINFPLSLSIQSLQYHHDETVGD